MSVSIRARAKGAGSIGEANWSTPLTIFRTTKTYSAPDDLALAFTNVRNTSMIGTINPSGYVGTKSDLRYEYYFDLASGTNISHNTTSSTSISFTGLAENTRYRLQVRYHPYWSTHWSDWDSVYATTVVLLTMVVTSVVITQTDITITWSGSAARGDLSVYFASGNHGATSTSSSSSPSMRVSGLTADTAYFYAIRVHATGYVHEARIAFRSLGAVSTVTLSAVTVTGTTATGTMALTGSTNATLEVTNMTTSAVATVSVSGTSFTYANLSPGTTYNFRLKSASNSYSATRSVTTAHAVSMGAIISTHKSLQVNYTSSSATAIVTLITDGVATNVVSNSSPHTFTGLTPNKTYGIIVFSADRSAQTPQTNVATELFPIVFTSLSVSGTVATGVFTSGGEAVTLDVKDTVTGAITTVNVGASGFSYSNLLGGRTYEFQLKSEGEVSAVKSITTSKTVSITSLIPTHKSIQVNYASSTAISIITLITDGVASNISSNSSPYTFTGLVPNKTYQIIVFSDDRVVQTATTNVTTLVFPIEFTSLTRSGSTATGTFRATSNTAVATIKNTTTNTTTNLTVTGTTFTFTLTAGQAYTCQLASGGENSASLNVTGIHAVTINGAITTYNSIKVTYTSTSATSIVTILKNGVATNYTNTTSPYLISGLDSATEYGIVVTSQPASAQTAEFKITTEAYPIVFTELRRDSASSVSGAYTSGTSAVTLIIRNTTAGTTENVTVTGGTFSRTGLTRGAAYSFQLESEGALSVVRTINTPGTANIDSITATHDTVTVTYTVTSATAVILFSQGTTQVFHNVTSSPHTFTGLAVNTSYSARVYTADRTVASSTKDITTARVPIIFHTLTRALLVATGTYETAGFGTLSLVIKNTTTGSETTLYPTTGTFTYDELNNGSSYVFELRRDGFTVSKNLVLPHIVSINALTTTYNSIKVFFSSSSATSIVTLMTDGVGTNAIGVTSPHTFTGLISNKEYGVIVSSQPVSAQTAEVKATTELIPIDFTSLSLVDTVATGNYILREGTSATLEVTNTVSGAVVNQTIGQHPPFTYTGMVAGNTYSFRIKTTSGVLSVSRQLSLGHQASITSITNTATSITVNYSVSTTTAIVTLMTDGVATNISSTSSPYTFTGLVERKQYGIIVFSSDLTARSPQQNVTTGSSFINGFITLRDKTTSTIKVNCTATAGSQLKLKNLTTSSSSLQTVDASPYNFTGLTPRTTYEISLNQTGNAVYAPLIRVQTDSVAYTVLNVKLSHVTQTSARITVINPPAGVSKYKFSYTSVSVQTSRILNMTGLSRNTTYSVDVSYTLNGTDYSQVKKILVRTLDTPTTVSGEDFGLQIYDATGNETLVSTDDTLSIRYSKTQSVTDTANLGINVALVNDFTNLKTILFRHSDDLFGSVIRPSVAITSNSTALNETYTLLEGVNSVMSDKCPFSFIVAGN